MQHSRCPVFSPVRVRGKLWKWRISTLRLASSVKGLGHFHVLFPLSLIFYSCFGEVLGTLFGRGLNYRIVKIEHKPH